MIRKVIRPALALGTLTVLVSGCEFGGLNSLDMPGTAGHGEGSYTVTVELPDTEARDSLRHATVVPVPCVSARVVASSVARAAFCCSSQSRRLRKASVSIVWAGTQLLTARVALFDPIRRPAMPPRMLRRAERSGVCWQLRLPTVD